MKRPRRVRRLWALLRRMYNTNDMKDMYATPISDTLLWSFLQAEPCEDLLFDIDVYNFLAILRFQITEDYQCRSGL